MAWDKLAGQAAARRTLESALAAGAPAHAYLFAGPEGTGKETAARLFAQGLLCGRGAQACGACRHCRKVAAGSHPDVRVIRPDGAHLKIEQIRQMTGEIALRPLEAARKVYIIDETEKMTPEAANALLKTLEEPPAYAVLILLTTRPEAVVPTIVSRCQVVRFTRVPAVEIRRRLVTEHGLSEAEAALAADRADGSVGRAVALAAAGSLALERDEVFAGVERLTRGIGVVETVRQLEKAAAAEREKWLDWLLCIGRDLLVWQATGDATLLRGGLAADRLQSLAGLYTAEELTAFLGEIEKTKLMLQQNINPGLALEVLLLALVKPADSRKEEGYV